MAPTTTAAPSTAPPPPAEGNGLARLEIPKIGVDKIVVEGVGVEDLRKGPGHYPGTALPGVVGNVAIAGHRTTYGAPFGDIDKLKPGDEIILTTVTGRYVYNVTGTQDRQPVGDQRPGRQPRPDPDADVLPPEVLGQPADHRLGRLRPGLVVTAPAPRRPPSVPSTAPPTPRAAPSTLPGENDSTVAPAPTTAAARDRGHHDARPARSTTAG